MITALQWPRGRRRRTHDQTARPEVPLAASPSPRPCRTVEPSEHPSLCRGAFANSPAGLEGARTISALPRRPRPRVAVAPLPTQVPSTDRPRARAIGAADGRGQDGVTRMDRADHCRSRRPPSATAIDRAATPLATQHLPRPGGPGGNARARPMGRPPVTRSTAPGVGWWYIGGGRLSTAAHSRVASIQSTGGAERRRALNHTIPSRTLALQDDRTWDLLLVPGPYRDKVPTGSIVRLTGTHGLRYGGFCLWACGYIR